MRTVNGDGTASGVNDPSGLSTLVERFEAAWQAGQRPDIAAHLPPGGGRSALVELAHVELEWRLKAGEAARVEDYLRRFPELASDAAVVLDLMAAEYALRRRSEPGLSTAEYARRFPALSDQLTGRFGTDRPGPAEIPSTRVEGPAVPSTHAEGAAALVPCPEPSAAPRYRPVRFHARGGLGEVHVARDGELGREVALKRIRPEHAHDPESRARFLREAEVTARLEHPGVVPVHGLMLDEGGHACYAMRFIQGQTLAEAIRRFHEADRGRRDPGERALAQRGLLARFVAVCDTISYAHSRGVLHRDLKPANVMLGPYGETLVLDWGLAKPFDRGEEARASGEGPVAPAAGTGAEGTRTGQAAGTPAYMSPEQAAGRWAEVGPASDVYGLGATLYHLLTGEAPFRGPGLEVLGRVQRGDFPPPQVKGAVPPALEAVCLKAMALRPGQRYGSARELKQDVENWLAGERVGAWREPLRVRAGRWARRHRTQVAALAAAALVAALAGGAGAWWWGQQRAERRQAVEAGLAEVGRLQGEARWGEARAVLAQAERRQGAGGPPDLQDRLGRAKGELGLVTRLDAVRLKRATAAEGDFDFAGADRDYGQAFRGTGLGEPGGDPAVAAAWVRDTAVRAALVAALDDWALCTADRGRRAWLLEVARRADPGPWQDMMRDPAVWDDGAALARLAADAAALDQSPQLLTVLGARLQKVYLPRRGTARAPPPAAPGARPLADAEAFLRRAQERYPGDIWINMHLGNFLGQAEKYEEAVGYFRAALAVRPGTGGIHYSIGNARHAQGRLEEAAAEYRRAVHFDPPHAPSRNNLGIVLREQGRMEEAVAEWRQALQLAPNLLSARNNLGNALAHLGKVDEAVAELRKALELEPEDALAHNNLGLALYGQGKRDEALAEYRKALQLDPKLALAHSNLGVALRDQGKPDEAAAEFRRAVQLDPKSAEYHTNLGASLDAQGKPDEALAEYRKAVELGPRLSEAHNNLGTALHVRGRSKEAVAAFRKAVELGPRNVQARYNLGNALHAQGKLDEAAVEYRRALELDPRHSAAHGNLGSLLRIQRKLDEAVAELRQAIRFDPKNVHAYNNLGLALLNLGRPAEAAAEFRKAIARDARFAQPHGGLALALVAEGRFAEARQATQRCLELLPEKGPARARVAQQLRDCEQLLALDKRLAAFLQGEARPAGPDELLGFAEICALKKRPADAVRCYAEAFAARPQLADDWQTARRYNAACAAALAAGRAPTDEKERARLRRRALDWLRADLALLGREVDRGAPQARREVQRALRHWRADPDLAGVRNTAALEKLPEPERAACRQLWADVAALLERCEETDKAGR